MKRGNNGCPQKRFFFTKKLIGARKKLDLKIFFVYDLWLTFNDTLLLVFVIFFERKFKHFSNKKNKTHQRQYANPINQQKTPILSFCFCLFICNRGPENFCLNFWNLLSTLATNCDKKICCLSLCLRVRGFCQRLGIFKKILLS